jgi:hypothetical protein
MRHGGDPSLKNKRGESVVVLAKGYQKAEQVLQEYARGGVRELEKYGDLPGIKNPNNEL